MYIEPLASSDGACCLLQLDKSLALAQHFGLAQDDQRVLPELLELTSMLLKYLSPQATGALLDPVVSYYSLSYKNDGCGVAFCLDSPTKERDLLKPPPRIAHWGIEHIANNTAVAKLELYYNPYEPDSALKKALVAETFSYAQHEGIPFLLELLLFEHPAKDHQFDELQLFAVQEFRSYCDILALDYPQSPLGAATITTELAIPWVVAHRTETYESFKEVVRTCVESGARGFLAGEVLWQDTPWWQSKTLDLVAAEQSLQTTVRDRSIELSRIVHEQLAASQATA